MDRRTEPPIWPPDESEIPEENEIPERRRGSSGFLFSGGTCARDGLAYAAGLALSVSHRLDCGSSARRINRQTGSSPAPFGHQVLWPLDSAGAPVGGGIFQEKLVVARTLFARSRGKQPDSFDQRIVIRPSPGHECTAPWGLPRRSAAARSCGAREELASGLSDVLFMQQGSEKRTTGH
jgi:hypothetical protein